MQLTFLPALLPLCAGVLFSMTLDPLAEGRPTPLVIAHRGGSHLGPENTLAAAQAGFDAGADMWELDTQLTKDGVPILLHDRTLKRTTNVRQVFPRRANQPLSAFTLAEIKKLEAGSWWAAGTGKKARDNGWITQRQWVFCQAGKVKVPTLEAALLFTKKLGWRVNVEIKVPAPGQLGRLVPRVLTVIRKTGMIKNSVISCFDHAVCYAVAQSKEPHPAVQVLNSGRLGRPDLYVKNVIGGQALNPSFKNLGFGGREETWGDPDPALVIKRLRTAGLDINVWTINTKKDFATAVKLGVTGIITDRPDLARAFLKK